MKSPSKGGRPRRHPSGVDGLDIVLRGGLFKGGIYIVSGPPGVGKTILGNQACFRHAAAGGRALFVSLLSESHAQMLLHMQSLDFYDHAHVGNAISYLSAYKVIEDEGLDGLRNLLRNSVREHRADLLVVDGVMTVESLAESPSAYKKFIHELQAWVGLVGCTVLLLTSSPSDTIGSVLPAHTMVDGIIEMRTALLGPRMVRQLMVAKFRGGEYLEGTHSYRITARGMTIFPRLETLVAAGAAREPRRDRRVATGVAGFDTLFGGGYPEGSTTLVLGSSGSGKTLLGLHFLEAGLRQGEPVVAFTFFETPERLREKARRLGLFARRAPIEIIWQPPFEGLLDELAGILLDRVATTGARRLFLDGLVGFKEAAGYPPRLAGFFSALCHELAARGVTTLITEETRELFVREIEVPAPGVSAIFDNIIFLRQVEEHAALARLISIMKSRDSDHDRSLRQFHIGHRGIVLGNPFARDATVLTGIAAWSDADHLLRVAPRKPGDKRRGE